MAAKTGKPGADPIEIDIDLVEGFASRGLTMGQIAEALGIHESTLSRRRKQYAEVEEAIKRGQAKGIGEVTNALFKQIKDGNVTATIFYLKCRAGWKEAAADQNINLNLPGSITRTIVKCEQSED